jgi:putative serine protease PepD
MTTDIPVGGPTDPTPAETPAPAPASQPLPGVPPASAYQPQPGAYQPAAPQPPAPYAPAPQAPAAAPAPAPQPPAPPASPYAAEPTWAPRVGPAEEPLPVCDYTSESDAPCEEPAVAKRWSSAAVVTSATLGALVGGLLVAAAIVWAFGLAPGSNRSPLGATNGVTVAPTKVSINAMGTSLDVAQAVAKKAVPSVVNLTIQQAAVDPFSGTKSYQDMGNGSGIIIRQDGYILTNNHVVNGADRIMATVGVENKVAKVVGVDPTTDIAVLKIEGTGYPAIEIGSSKDLQVGQWVMAVGSPFGLEKTVTSGIVSALQRSEQAQGQTSNDITTYTNLIQTDAAINPGNSGGALVDESGKLVGLNSLIQSPSGGVGAAQSAGIGFAIPVDFAIDIARQIIAGGTVSHPYLGVSTQTVDESVAAQYGLNVKSGALVRFVSPNSPANTGGIKAGDIITKIGDTPITSVADVFAGIRLHKIGESVPVLVVRNNQQVSLSVVLGSDSATGK